MVLSHGSMSYPLSRIYACYLEGPESPDTLACRDAIAAGGTQPLYDWNEVNLPDVNGQHRDRIPDGRLCSAGRDKYAAFDQPRTDWYRTVLSPASSYTFRYAATAPHNQGYFEIYLTRPGYDPTQPLTWADLEQIARIDEPPLVAGYYLLEGVTLPADRVGHHLLYTIWQRTDSPEAFYACSDVWLGTEPTPTPTPAPPCSEPAWQPGQLYEAGSRVSHQGRVWQARWTNLDVEPDSEPASGPWEIVGYCTAGEAGTPTPPPATPAATPTPTPTAEASPAPSQGYTVQGNQILDPAGTPLLLRGVSWFGFETHEHVVHGLWARNWQAMITQMADLGFNAVRIPVCPATLQDSPVSSIDYSRNPDLQGLTSLAILDRLLQAFDQQGFYILLDHHRPDCNAISELWYTESYSEEQWIDDLVFMAQRYSHLAHFLGIDLKNEPHGAATWGTGNPATDWDLAAARAAAAVLAANPNLLIFVEGIQENPTCSGDQNHWWGGNLEPLACTPLAIPREKLVLSPHVYGPDVYVQPYFNHADFPANLPAIWEAHFGQFADDYPVVIGEFGGRYGHGGDPRDRTWQDALVDYLVQKGIRSSFYWSWNANSGDTGGILQDDWNQVWSDKVALLHRLWGLDGTPLPSPSPSPSATASPPASTATPVPPSTPTGAPPALCRVHYQVESVWEGGFVANVAWTYLGSQRLSGWELAWTFPAGQRISQIWNGVVSQEGDQVRVRHADWNAAVEPNGQVTFGFLGTWAGENPAPTQFRLNGQPCLANAAQADAPRLFLPAVMGGTDDSS
ncbi:MAG: hypothetical protein KatS3mg050_0126 [Litorilinea sp.]|nr:MAG: hypothetical protein KatS3mg050_0126 [Litorilinea sp.]